MRKTHLFVSEFLTSGALAGQPLPPSLLQEGEMMWQALIEDILQLDYCRVTTTFDPRLVPPSHPRLN